ncbi:cyanophycin synthetase [Brevundimonas diminuta]|uniref:cyanophycin synthetase n=2 Tax=Brevundimonas diminuta TaxID=293 RepID=UPI00209BA93F|nr:cyanophycin synthetase [Brevundimonas diminuta]MCO8018801.1 cyanophycin synthetase [Brevundimonas diminuta]
MNMTTTSGEGAMQVLERSVYRGPHLYSARPMVRIRLDLGRMEDWPTDRLGDFSTRLLEALPGLDRHGCCYGEPGGFVRRLRDGTWFGHVAEHVALELQTRAGTPVTRGKTRSVRGQPGVYDILFTYRDETTALLAGRLALQLCDALLPEALAGISGLDRVCADDLDPRLPGAVHADQAAAILRDAVRRTALGPSTQALVDAARRRGIPVERLNTGSLLRLGWGARQRRLRASVTDRTGLIAAELAGDKAQAKALLEAVGCPTARGEVVRTADEAAAAAARLGDRVVVKPLDGNHGRGVTTGLDTPEAVRKAFALAAPHGRRVIVEQELPGRDYRVLVVDGRVVAVAERRPPCIEGDGRRSVAELVEEVNADPRRGVGHENSLTLIRLDEEALTLLARQGLSPQSVPGLGVRVLLRTAANLSSGGTATDRTDEIHPANAAIVRRAALALGLDVAGVDLLAPDIRRSVRDTGGGVVEVNAAPGLRMHLSPSEGEARDVAGPVLDMMFPRGVQSRIPVIAVTGTNGKSTVGRMIAHVLQAEGRVVGLTNTSGVYVDGERIRAGDASGPRSARMVLNDPVVDVAVLECARGGILREGLAFDRCDVGCVLNVQPDHLGLKGVDTLEDLAKVKSVVAEAVSRRGLSVLNADDPLTLRMARHAGGRVCWFSMRGGAETPGFLLKHVAEGGAAVLYDAESGVLELHDRGERRRLGHAADLPSTLGGAVAFNVANILAAAAACYGVGVPPERIGAALGGFTSSYEQNPGRLNICDQHGFRVIMDYAHNPDGLRALGALVAAVRPAGGRTIAMISIPGDRRTQEIVAMGEISASFFDEVVFRETPDNRGRPAGEVIRLLAEGALRSGADASRFRGVQKEEEAVTACLEAARPGDLVVLTPTRIEAVWAQIMAFQPTFPSSALGLNAPGVILEPPHG